MVTVLFNTGRSVWGLWILGVLLTHYLPLKFPSVLLTSPPPFVFPLFNQLRGIPSPCQLYWPIHSIGSVLTRTLYGHGDESAQTLELATHYKYCWVSFYAVDSAGHFSCLFPFTDATRLLLIMFNILRFENILPCLLYFTWPPINLIT